jgi:hypothetical protein
MKNLRLVCLLLFPAAVYAAPDVKAQSQKLEAARTTLISAVERIKKDPPANEDLDAAHAAVEALKEAIDQGAELEAGDLDYAKAALAGRKELRTQRDYVDQRRGQIKMHDARRGIDAAAKGLDEKVQAVQAKDPEAKAFDDARAAAEALKKIADEARPFAPQDQKFARYLAETDASVGKQLKVIDERQTALAVEKQRAQLEPARAALKAAVAALGSGATDDQFHAGDDAAKAVAKLLEAGKPLEAKHKGYQGDAEKARAELTASKKKMDELWSATGLARLKAEVDPAYKDLIAAAKPVHGKPTADQLAEARTATLVVRKLTEKFQADAERSQAFGQYMAQVKRVLVDTESEIEKRSLLVAEIDVGNAQRAVEKPQPADERFDELTTAMTVLEKTIASVHAQEPAMEKPVGEANWVLGQAKGAFAKRRLEVDIERQRGKVEEAKKLAADALQQLQAPAFTAEQIQQAENAVKLIGTVLEKGTELIEQDKTYAWYDGEVKKRIAELNDKIAAKKILLAANNARTALVEGLASAKQKIDAAKAPEGKDSDVDASAKAVEGLNKMLEEQAPLEKQNGAYAGQAEKTRNALYGLTDTLEFAKECRTLRKTTGEQLMAGAAAADSAAQLPDLRARKAQYVKALGLFRSCQSDAPPMLQVNPALAKIPVLVDGKPNKPLEVIDQCTSRVESTNQLMRDVLPLIKFEDGPRKAYELAKGLLGKSKKPEALAQFNECIATGIILQHDNPELSDHEFEVAGAKMTLAQVVKQCVEQRKVLQPAQK